jgi:hypothetical protein
VERGPDFSPVVNPGAAERWGSLSGASGDLFMHHQGGQLAGRAAARPARARTTRILKEAIILATESIGEDGRAATDWSASSEGGRNEELPAYLSH